MLTLTPALTANMHAQIAAAIPASVVTLIYREQQIAAVRVRNRRTQAVADPAMQQDVDQVLCYVAAGVKWHPDPGALVEVREANLSRSYARVLSNSPDLAGGTRIVGLQRQGRVTA